MRALQVVGLGLYLVAALWAQGTMADSGTATGAPVYTVQSDGSCNITSTVSVTASSPADMCGAMQRATGFLACGWGAGHTTHGTAVCSWAYAGTPGQWQVKWADVAGSGQFTGGISFTGPCWGPGDSNRGDGSYGHQLPTCSGGGTAQACPTGYTFSDAQGGCIVQGCPEGQIYDSDISACRPQCVTEGTFYHYESHACQKQCPVGQNSNYAVRFRGTVNYDGPIDLNGCPAMAHTYCTADSSGLSPDGQTCYVWFEYAALISVHMDEQATTDSEGAGYYTNEAGASAVITPTPTYTGDYQEFALDFSNATNIQSTYFVCQDGAPKAIVFADDHTAQYNMMGSCTGTRESLIAGSLDNGIPADQATEISSKVDGVKTAVDTTKSVVDAVKVVADSNATKLDTANSGISTANAGIEHLQSTVDGIAAAQSVPPDEGTFDGPATGEAYTQQHTGGVAGAVGTGDMGETQLGQYLVNGLTLHLGDGLPECPSWDFPAMPGIMMPGFTFNPPCEMWNILADLVIAISTFCAWALVWRF